MKVDLKEYHTKKHNFKPKTLDVSDLKQVFNTCIGSPLSLRYVHRNRVAVYGCTVHGESCSKVGNVCTELPTTPKKLQDGCIKVTCFQTVQPKVATKSKISIPRNSLQLTKLFKYVCFETCNFYIYVSCKNGKIDISYLLLNRD
jgi:hypothetical protein